MKTLILALIAIGTAGAASAEMWKDYTPGKGVWQVSMVRVDPNHLDDYLVGLKTTWVPGVEIAKRQGVIDDYKILTSDNQGEQTNVLLMTHVVSYAMLEPNQARDQALEKELFAATPRTRIDSKVADYEKYRTFTGSGNFGEIVFAK